MLPLDLSRPSALRKKWHAISSIARCSEVSDERLLSARVGIRADSVTQNPPWGLGTGHCWIFNTQAGCGRKSSGNSGSSIDKPAFVALNFNGIEAPSNDTDCAELTFFTRSM